MIGDVIYSLLSNNATVSGLVGTKIYGYIAKREISYPYIIYELDSVDPTNTKDGVSELDECYYDVEVYAKSNAELTTVKKAVRDTLDRYVGTVNGKVINGIRYDGELSGYDMKDMVYMNVQKFKIRYKK